MEKWLQFFLLSTVLLVSVENVLSMERIPLQQIDLNSEKAQLLQLAEARMGQVKKYLSERWLGSRAQEHARKAMTFLGLIKKTLKDSAVVKNYQEAVHRYIELIVEQVALAERAAENQQEDAVTVTETMEVDQGVLQNVIKIFEELRVKIASIRYLTTPRWQGRQAQQYALQAYDFMQRAERILQARPLARNFEHFFNLYVQRSNENMRQAELKAVSELPEILQMEAELRRQREKREQRRQAAQNQDGSSYQQKRERRERAGFGIDGSLEVLEQAYSTLGIAREDYNNIDMIKNAYRTLARENHPDKIGNTQEAVQAMQRINAAYKELKELLHF